MVNGFQTIYGNGTRDNVKLNEPVFTDDIEEYRGMVAEKYGCASVNLTYTEIDKDKIKNLKL